MLNKELMLLESARKPLLTISIGQVYGTLFGYNRGQYGSIDIEPYWDFNGRRYSLITVDYGSRIQTTSATLYSGDFSTTGFNTLTISTKDAEVLLKREDDSINYQVKGDVFDLAKNVGNTFQITDLYPPPTVIWILLQKSQSRVLRRRRSLGGAKC